MKKKSVSNADLKIVNINASRAINPANKTFIKGSRLLKKLARVSDLLKEPSLNSKEAKSKKLNTKKILQHPRKRRPKKRLKSSTINKFLDLKWRRKLKRRFRLLSKVLLRLYPLRTANKPLRRVFLHKYISSNFNYKRSFIARQKARVANLLRLQGVITKRFYGWITRNTIVV
jgi:hypothetical protein